MQGSDTHTTQMDQNSTDSSELRILPNESNRLSTNTVTATLNTSRSDPSIKGCSSSFAFPNIQYRPKLLQGHCLRKGQSYLRMRPYWVPERCRTKSENADTSSHTLNMIDQISNSATTAILNTAMDTVDTMDVSTSSYNHFATNFLNSSSVLVTRVKFLKKSKSLENLRTENLDGSQPSHEMEFVSSRIQKLKVDE